MNFHLVTISVTRFTATGSRNWHQLAPIGQGPTNQPTNERTNERAKRIALNEQDGSKRAGWL